MHTKGLHVKVKILPSGEAVLACSETDKPIRHLGDAVYLTRVVHSPAKPDRSYADIVVKARVPLECDAGEPFELVGVYANANGCDCPVEVDETEEVFVVE